MAPVRSRLLQDFTPEFMETASLTRQLLDRSQQHGVARESCAGARQFLDLCWIQHDVLE